jgi:hypothetical protein
MAEFAELSLAPTFTHEAGEDAALTLANIMGMIRAPIKHAGSKEDQFLPARPETPRPQKNVDSPMQTPSLSPCPHENAGRKEEQFLPAPRPDTPRPHTNDLDLLSRARRGARRAEEARRRLGPHGARSPRRKPAPEQVGEQLPRVTRANESREGG